jgi:hypothetical protein
VAVPRPELEVRQGFFVVKAWSSPLRCRVPSLFGELQVRRQLSDLAAAGCWLGPANGNL